MILICSFLKKYSRAFTSCSPNYMDAFSRIYSIKEIQHPSKFVISCVFYKAGFTFKPETYSEPCQTSKRTFLQK